MTRPSYGRGVLAPILRGALESLEARPTSIFVLMDRRAKAAAAPMRRALDRFGVPTQVRQWWPSEEKKTLEGTEALMRWMVRGGVDRGSLLLAVGGGITTDLGGFAAACVLRGIRWGAVPTTLLGMADAASPASYERQQPPPLRAPRHESRRCRPWSARRSLL